MRIAVSKLMMVTAFAAFAALSAGCVDEGDIDPDEDLYPEDREELADESIPDEVDIEEGAEEALICQPGTQEFGRVVRLSADAQGRIRARGNGSNDNPGRCPSSVVIRLTRNGTRIDSQNKHCAENSCTSRLLSAGNPAGTQEFCATVRNDPGGPVRDRKCIRR
ncbi:MAG TPA: hypothetical protein VNO33_16885 [Kofleriaceae bacterium]|nr:hypothetical protein [Kofleriaceae bacterium]